MNAQHRAYPERLLMVGFYGKANFGDDLMCRAAIINLLESTPLRLIVSTHNTAPFADLGGERVSFISRRPTAIIRAILGCDLICQAGGTIFHDSYRGTSYWKYLGNLLAWLALFTISRLKGAEVVMIGAGIGPLRTGLARAITNAALNFCAAIGVRDAPSLHTTQMIRCKSPVVEGYDLALLLAPPKVKPSSIVGISTCDLARFASNGDGNALWPTLGRALSRYALRNNVKIRLLSLYSADNSTSDDFTTRLVVEQLADQVDYDIHVYHDDPDETLAALAECSVLIVTRYHAAVAAFLLDRPFAAIHYNRKVKDFAQQVRLPARRSVDPTKFPPERQWIELLDDLFAAGNWDTPSRLQARKTAAEAVQHVLAQRSRA